MSQIPWQWDPNKKEYYYFSSSENAYVYENGLRVYLSGANQAEYELALQHFPEKISLTCPLVRSSRGSTVYNTDTTPHGAGNNAQFMQVTDQLGNLSLT